jgi:hypothetical protein
MAGSFLLAGKRAGSAERGRPGAVAGVALLVALGALGLAVAGGGMAAGLWEGMLYLLPALLLLLPLLARRYPGERLIGALRVRRARARARVAGALRGIELPVPHGGRLIAVSLAGRAPPRAWAAACGC